MKINKILFTSLFILLFSFFFFTSSVSAATTLYEGNNTGLSGDDDSQSIPIGFTFNFYGTNYTSVHVNINGMLNFGSGSSEYSNTGIPNSGSPNNFIAPFWDDIITQGSSRQTIYYYVTGSAPNRKLIVQWTNMYFYSNPTLQMGTFQVILHETSNVIHMRYPSLLGGSASLGSSATIGVENSTGSSGVQFSNGTASLTEGQCISYTPSGGTFTQNTNATCDDVLLFDPNAPDEPVLTAPDDGANEESLIPTFDWDPADKADTYTLLVSTTSNFSNIVVNQTGITATSYTPTTAFNPDTEFFWRVQAVNETTTALSEVRSFTTRHAPRITGSLGPAAMVNGSYTTDNTPEFTFTVADGNGAHTVSYRIEIDDNSDFSSPFIDYTSALGTTGAKTFTVGQAANGGTYDAGSEGQTLIDGNYYWRVRARDSIVADSLISTANNGSIAFRVLTGSPDITNISTNPSNTSVTVTWTTAQESSSRVEYGRVTSYGFQTSETDISPRVTNHSVTFNDLTPCSRYFFRVKSKNAANTEKTSGQNTFSTTGCVTSITDGSEQAVDPSSGGSISYTNNSSTVAITIPQDFSDDNSTFQINRLQTINVPTPPATRELVSNLIYDFSAVKEDSSEITTFDEPLTLVISYGGDVENNYVEGTLDLYGYVGGEWIAKNCTVDTTANSLTCSMESFSTYGVFGEEKAGDSTSGGGGSGTPGAPFCGNTAPQGTIDVFQIDASNSKATIHFTPINNNISEYFISYTLKKDEYMYGVAVPYGNSDGAIVYTINDLPPNSTFYVQVRAGNGCASGMWSNQVSFKTGNSETVKTSYYK